ncbi:MAG: hypothetical protein KC917_10585, partial [Candidatus Omnitrophica bacterium]|nr:hypothetical protein [Candidatus Omnitrophota bacterium]
MPCCLLVVVGLFPRVALVLMWLTGYAQAAFTTLLFPILGFLLMPYTTCAYAIGMVETGGFRGWTLILLIIAIALDLGHLGGSGAYQRRRTVVVE